MKENNNPMSMGEGILFLLLFLGALSGVVCTIIDVLCRIENYYRMRP